MAASSIIRGTLRRAPIAPRVALIHSLALDRSIWNGVVAELKLTPTLLTYDCRGHGQSPDAKPRSPRHCSPGRPCGTARSRRLAGMRTVAGCSMGGCIAQAFAAMYPEPQTRCMPDRYDRLVRRRRAGAMARTCRHRQRQRHGRARGLPTRPAGSAKRFARPIQKSRRAHQGISRQRCAVLPSDLRDARHEDLRPLLALIKNADGDVVGAEDYATPVSMAESLHEAIPHSTLAIFHGRHITPVECPQDIARALKKAAEGLGDDDRCRASPGVVR